MRKVWAPVVAVLSACLLITPAIGADGMIATHVDTASLTDVAHSSTARVGLARAAADGPVMANDGLSEAELSDITNLSRVQDISVDEGIRRYAGFDAFRTLREDVASQFPNLYVAGTWEEGEGTISITGEEIPIELEQLLADSPITVTLSRGHELPLVELESLVASLNEDFKEFDSGVQYEIDATTPAVDVLFTGGVPTGLGAISEVVPEAVEVNLIPFGVGPVTLEDTKLRGGALLNGSGCLTSYTLRSASGNTIRMGTAAHCDLGWHCTLCTAQW